MRCQFPKDTYSRRNKTQMSDSMPLSPLVCISFVFGHRFVMSFLVSFIVLKSSYRACEDPENFPPSDDVHLISDFF